jgi:carbonic anhydrase/acetyltransferase-like protein (isoleucine patch superfamily)
MKKYEMTSNTKEFSGHKLFQIKALKNFGSIKAGDLGGYIEKEENLSHDGRAWVYNNAQVYDNAVIFNNAEVYGNAKVYGNARVFGNAQIFDNVLVRGNAQVYGDTLIYGNVLIYDNAQVSDNAKIFSNAYVFGNAIICGNVLIYGNAWIYDDALICSNADYICFRGFSSEGKNTSMFKTRNGEIYVNCGCFKGSLKEFSEKVKEMHGNSKYEKEYLARIKVVKIYFKIGD